MSEAVIYTQRRKALHFTGAMMAGFPAREVESAPGRVVDGAGLHILGGLQFGSLELMQKLMPGQAAYLFWDNAYFGGGTQTDRLRLTSDGYQQARINPARAVDLRRFHTMGGSLKPWRSSGRHIMLVPPSQAVCQLFGLGDKWEVWATEEIRQYTDRPIMISRKGDLRPLENRLKDCHCVVTFSSNVAVLAVCAGVPAFTSQWSAAAPVSKDLTMLQDIEAPATPERDRWAASLAWGQFTTTEIRSGFARAALLEVNA